MLLVQLQVKIFLWIPEQFSMVYRETVKSDIKDICNLYRDIFHIKMTDNLYDYWYLNQDNKYNSIVAVHDGKVVGHNAIICNDYYVKKKKVNVGLSSGGMVNPEFSGIFYQILKQNILKFKGDILIAFPNKNSEKFFTKIFQFNSIDQNYYSLNQE